MMIVNRGVAAWAWHGRKGVATCSGERPMVQGGGAIRWVGEHRVAPARTLMSVTHRSQGAADGPLVVGVHVRRGTTAGKHGALATTTRFCIKFNASVLQR
jgi:hypothetical protein